MLRCWGVHLHLESQNYAESARSREARETVVGVSTNQWQGRIRRSFPTLTAALSRQDQISMSDSLTLLRYRLWAVMGSAEDAQRRLMPPSILSPGLGAR